MSVWADSFVGERALTLFVGCLTENTKILKFPHDFIQDPLSRQRRGVEWKLKQECLGARTDLYINVSLCAVP